jgi:hypothetical protein
VPVGRIVSLALRAALAIIVIAFFVQVGVGFSSIYTRLIEVVLIAATVIPIVVVLVAAFAAYGMWVTARINRLLGLGGRRGS